jgi:hypothetical protein
LTWRRSDARNAIWNAGLEGHACRPDFIYQVHTRSTAKASGNSPELMSCRMSPRGAQQVSSAQTSVNYVHPHQSGLLLSQAVHPPTSALSTNKLKGAQRTLEYDLRRPVIMVFELIATATLSFCIRHQNAPERPKILDTASCIVSVEGLPF